MFDFAGTVARKKMEALAQILNSSKAERAKKMLVSAMTMQTNTAILVSVGACANFRMASGGLVDFIVRLVSLRYGGNLLFVWSSE